MKWAEHSCLAVALGAFASLAATPRAQSEGLQPALNAAREWKPILDLRLRSESVDQAGLAEEADAITLRARLGFETGKAWNTSLLIEADLLWPLDSDYNSTVNGKTTYPIVADPETYELNRLQITNSSLPGTTVTLGRQRINLDDQRFVGAVGWRQNEQTFDSMRVVNASIPNVTFDLAYVNQVNRVVGKDSPVGRHHGDNYLANIGYKTPFGKVSGFVYLLDLEESPADSSSTIGVRVTGERTVSNTKLLYSASYATQRDRAGSPLDYANDYYAFELSGAYRQYSLGVGLETLEGDGVRGFATPLATLHKFQGWADKFLTTPPNGVDDRHVVAGYTTKGAGFLDSLSATVVYHEFDSARSSLDYGTEVDLQLQAKWRRYSGTLKYADYDADQFATDTRKLWVQMDFIW
jgi:hypothetical protein